MVRTSNPTHVTGKWPHFKVQPWIDHPAFCVCARCAKLPEKERSQPHSFRINRASPFKTDSKTDYLSSAQYALQIKAAEEGKLTAGGDGWMAASAEQITFAQIASAYLEAHDSERNAAIIRLHLVPFLGALPASHLKAADFRSYQRKRTQTKASPDTINREWNVLRAILNFAEREERIARNPIQRGAVELLPSRGPRKEFFEPEEWRGFLAAFDDYEGFKRHQREIDAAAPVRIINGYERGTGRRNPDSDSSRDQFDRMREAKAFVRDLLFSCARVMELAGTRWRDLDLRRSLATIYQEKTEREKVIPIAEPWRADLAARPRGLPEAYVYVHSNGQSFYDQEVRRAMELAMGIAGIRKHLTPHSIRHTCLSWLAIAGVSEAHRKELAGHSRKSVADGYAHLTRGSLVPVVALLARIEEKGFSEGESAAEAREERV